MGGDIHKINKNLILLTGPDLSTIIVTIKKAVTIIIDNCTLIVKMVDSCTIVLVVASPLANTNGFLRDNHIFFIYLTESLINSQSWNFTK